MSTLNVAVADEKKNMQSLLKGMEFLGTARSSDEAYNMINGNAGSDVVLVYVKRASGDTEPLDRAPVGPRNRNEPIGFVGSLIPALERMIASETLVTASFWPITLV